MLSRSGYARAISADLGDIERRVHALERSLERIGGRASAGATQVADRMGETIASALTNVADRFRDGAGAMSGEVARFRGEATKLGNTAVRRLSDEVEQHPLITLAVAVGVGILVGLASSQRHPH
jgi:ElaB/YqjD/DUF883 family membrane-anchored ribosome-binding protein